MPRWELIVVLVIVGAAAVWAVRAVWRSVRRGSVCPDCADGGDCPLAGNPELLDELQRRLEAGELEATDPGRRACSELLSLTDATVDPAIDPAIDPTIDPTTGSSPDTPPDSSSGTPR